MRTRSTLAPLSSKDPRTAQLRIEHRQQSCFPATSGAAARPRSWVYPMGYKGKTRRGYGSYPGFVVVPPQQLISWRCTGQNRLLPNLPLPAEVLKHAVKSGTLPSVASATYTPLHYNPLSGDPQKGTPNCWKSPCRVLITAASQDFCAHFSH